MLLKGGDHVRQRLQVTDKRNNNTLVKRRKMLIRNYRKNIGLMAGVGVFAFLGITSFGFSFSVKTECLFGRLDFWKYFHTTSLLCEIPSGMLADRYSIRPTFI